MAKNFTDFKKLEGTYIPPVYPAGESGYLTGITNTAATTGMMLVGYEFDEPHGERQYTVESVLLAAEPYHVGLENVTNESKEHMFADPMLTGSVSADDLIVIGNLDVQGTTTQLNTTTFATSSFSIKNLGTTVALKVEQTGSTGCAQFFDGDEIMLDLADGKKVGILGAATPGYDVTIYGTISAYGPLNTHGAVNGRDMQQDGRKLDDLAPYSDVTSIALSSVSTDLAYLKATVPFYSNVVIDKGFDLLEDGDTYKKIPALATTNANYSTEKITGIENGADVTGDHSADIILNDVPDGPWTGNKATTFVKVTSADRDRVTTIRGVSGALYTGDAGGDITNDDIASAYHEAYPNFWSTSDESEYRNIVVPKVNDVYTDHVAVSANRDAVITKVENTSADWDSVYTDVSETSADWNTAYADYLSVNTSRDAVITKVENTSADWDTAYADYLNVNANRDAVITKVENTSADWDDVYTSVNNTSASWNASVNNTGGVNLPDGEAQLSNLSVTSGLSASGTTRISGEVYCLSGADWKQGLTQEIDVGGTILQFIDGILVNSRPE